MRAALGPKRILQSEERTRAWLEAHAVQNRRAYALPDWSSRTYDIWEDASRGVQVLYFGGDRQPKQSLLAGRVPPTEVSVLYLHGGAFARRPTNAHLRFCGRLANALWAPLVMPLPGLAPGHHTFEATDLAESLYHDLVRRGRRVVLAGDGSGAGIALGLLCRLPEEGVPQPLKTVLVSPWLDLELNDPQVRAMEPLDVRLSAPGLRALAQAWAGDLDLADPYVSPLNYGDECLARLRNVTIACGGRDLMLPDARRLAARLDSLGVDHELLVDKDAGHSWPLGGGSASAGFRARLVRQVHEAERPRLGA